MRSIRAAIPERPVLVDDDAVLPYPHDTKTSLGSSAVPSNEEEEEVYESSLDGNPVSSRHDSNTKENVHNLMTIGTTTEAIEIQKNHPRSDITYIHPAPTTVSTTVQVIENPDHTEVMIEGSSMERMTTTHISEEEEDGGGVARSLAKLEDADSVCSSTTTTTVDCVDHREVVLGDGNISLIPTIIGNDHDENQEVSVEDYIETTMVSTKFHTVSPDSDRTENNGSFQPHEDRRRVHFVECEAIEEVGINGDDDRIHTFHIGDTPNNEHDENRNHTRPTAINTPSPRQKCANTDGTTKHVVAFTRKTVPRVGQHRGTGKNRRLSDEKTHVQPNKRTRR